MTKIKICRVKIENFRLFTCIIESFDGANFIVFDGPNGFGKTSFYDAIELFLTGKIRRYDEWEKVVTDRRKSYGDNPIPYNRNNNDLIIKIELEIKDQKMSLMRKGKRSEINKKRISDLKIPMYKLKNFDDNDGPLIPDEEKYLAELLGNNYRENFRFLHYIEQEENIFLLKSSDKERKDSIDYLFNTIEFQAKIEKIKSGIKKMGELCGQRQRGHLENISSEIANLKKSISGESRECGYFRLMNWRMYAWDEPKIEFKSGEYANYVGGDGILERIKQFVANFNEFKKINKNKILDSYLARRDQLTQIILYYKDVEKVNDYVEKQANQEAIKNYLIEIDKGALNAIVNGKIDLGGLSSLLTEKIDVRSYSVLKAKILELHKTMSSFSEAATSLKESRISFVKKFNRYEQIRGGAKECPLCGYEWESSSELRSKLQMQEKKFDDLARKSGQELSSYLSQFENEYINTIGKTFASYLAVNQVDGKYVEELKRAARNKGELRKLFNEIESEGIRLNNYMTNDRADAVSSKLGSLIAEIENKKHLIDPERVKLYYADIYIKYFNENEENVHKITREDIEKKKRYIEWLYI